MLTGPVLLPYKHQKFRAKDDDKGLGSICKRWMGHESHDHSGGLGRTSEVRTAFLTTLGRACELARGPAEAQSQR